MFFPLFILAAERTAKHLILATKGSFLVMFTCQQRDAFWKVGQDTAIHLPRVPC